MRLLVLLVVLAVVAQATLYRWLPPPPRRDVANLIRGLLDNPWLMALWLGPVVWIGVALFEEVGRVFFLTRLWRVWPSGAAQWVVVVLFAVLFGVAHIYQGAPGVVSTAIFGLVMGAWFLRRGRLVPLVVSHALYDSVWIALGLMTMPR